ncbi:hypothetical protein SDC9_134119 [bioreactor metagenome]|uniref:Uncharacterized protein n=1 Tax=bioreactor metagenome TaxID=1076179 RepID=A0A645DC53_9ZZZZ
MRGEPHRFERTLAVLRQLRSALAPRRQPQSDVSAGETHRRTRRTLRRTHPKMGRGERVVHLPSPPRSGDRRRRRPAGLRLPGVQNGREVFAVRRRTPLQRRQRNFLRRIRLREFPGVPAGRPPAAPGGETGRAGNSVPHVWRAGEAGRTGSPELFRSGVSAAGDGPARHAEPAAAYFGNLAADLSGTAPRTGGRASGAMPAEFLPDLVQPAEL